MRGVGHATRPPGIFRVRSADKQQVRDLLAGTTDHVTLRFYTQAIGCDSCPETREILDMLADGHGGRRHGVPGPRAALQRARGAEDGGGRPGGDPRRAARGGVHPAGAAAADRGGGGWAPGLTLPLQAPAYRKWRKPARCHRPPRRRSPAVFQHRLGHRSPPRSAGSGGNSPRLGRRPPDEPRRC